MMGRTLGVNRPCDVVPSYTPLGHGPNRPGPLCGRAHPRGVLGNSVNGQGMGTRNSWASQRVTPLTSGLRGGVEVPKLDERSATQDQARSHPAMGARTLLRRGA